MSRAQPSPIPSPLGMERGKSVHTCSYAHLCAPSVLIAGCGYVGLALSRRLSRENFSVFGLRRSRNTEKELRRSGAEPIIADLLKPKTLRDLPPVDYVVCAQAPSRSEIPNYRSTYFTGTKNLIAALRSRPPKKLLWISSTSVYGDRAGRWVNENSEPKPDTKNGALLLESEQLVLRAPFLSLVVRLGGVYGPGRNRLHLLKKGIVSPRDSGYLNHIHVEDAARLIQFLLKRGKPGEIYLGVDNEPVLRSKFYRRLLSHIGTGVSDSASRPQTARKQSAARSRSSKRCSNKKIKALGFTFQYPTYRDGFRSLLPS